LQEKDVKSILYKNKNLLLSLASKLYDNGFISNEEIKKNYEEIK